MELQTQNPHNHKSHFLNSMFFDNVNSMTNKHNFIKRFYLTGKILSFLLRAIFHGHLSKERGRVTLSSLLLYMHLPPLSFLAQTTGKKS